MKVHAANHEGSIGNQSGAQSEEASSNPARYDLPEFILKQNTHHFSNVFRQSENLEFLHQIHRKKTFQRGESGRLRTSVM